ncbi:acetoacetate-CoA ligase [Emergomyces africanus]|uniref:Acetoacetate-CoA ligase n=1 Tax=Emergomyces africanus TaxID=1955775 RepID=A0A1B7NZI4_9EURO|nr:acetoacetate-CoA ligase [Emergomyces africanus]
MQTTQEPEKLWVSPHAGKYPVDDYRRHVNRRFSMNLTCNHELQRWSVTKPHDFWIDLYKYIGIIPELPSHITRAYDDSLPLSAVPKFFDGVNLNYTENVLLGKDPNAVALIGLREGDGMDGEIVTWAQLAERVRIVRSALLRNGIKEGDRVGALVSTSIWAVVLLLASASIGAIFSSISPDMGVEGCVTRLQQIEPAVVFADSDMSYKGKKSSLDSKIIAIMDNLSAYTKIFVIPITTQTRPKFPLIEEFLSKASDSDALEYSRVPFSHPLYILYSSDIVFQYSSTSWVLFNIMNGHLAVGATTICYDGSPLWPDATATLKILDRFRVTYWGTSPRYLLELEASKLVPRDEYDLSALQMVTTTGATLTADQYRWFYRVFPYIHLSSIAGGTDIASSCTLASDPSSPVYAGEMQIFALGMDVDVADPTTGESIKHTGESGELICRTPFPSMPVYFWGDKDNKKYKSSYFERFDNICVWAQHDWISVNPATGGSVMHGRSDGVLNPSGIRFGSAEIYSISEGPKFNYVIEDTLCVGRRRKQDKDEVVFLFVKMRKNMSFTDALEQRLRAEIRSGLSPRHVPKFIIETPDVPVTINGKKVEIAVKRIISGEKVQVSSTVANPQALKFYEQFVHMKVQPRAKL